MNRESNSYLKKLIALRLNTTVFILALLTFTASVLTNTLSTLIYLASLMLGALYAIFKISQERNIQFENLPEDEFAQLFLPALIEITKATEDITSEPDIKLAITLTSLLLITTMVAASFLNSRKIILKNSHAISNKSSNQLRRISQNIKEVIADPSTKVFYDNRTESSMLSFSTLRHKYVILTNRSISMYRSDRQLFQFSALHELHHLENRDSVIASFFLGSSIFLYPLIPLTFVTYLAPAFALSLGSNVAPTDTLVFFLPACLIPILFLFYLAQRRAFFHLREIASDLFASERVGIPINLGTYTPQDDTHPKQNLRKECLERSVLRINILPTFFLIFATGYTVPSHRDSLFVLVFPAVICLLIASDFFLGRNYTINRSEISLFALSLIISITHKALSLKPLAYTTFTIFNVKPELAYRAIAQINILRFGTPEIIMSTILAIFYLLYRRQQ